MCCQEETEDSGNGQESQKWTYEYESFCTERKALTDSEFKLGTQYDKTILALAGGSLGLSIAFVKDLLGGKPGLSMPLLSWAWILMTVSLLSSLVAVLVNQVAYRRQREILDEAYRAKSDPTAVPNPWAKAAGFANWLGLAAFIGGLAFLLVFTKVNVDSLGQGGSKENAENVKRSEQTNTAPKTDNPAKTGKRDGTAAGSSPNAKNSAAAAAATTSTRKKVKG